MDDIRIGLVGLGRVCAEVHFPGLSRIPGVEIAAICDSDVALLARRQDEWQAGQAHDSLDEMLRTSRLDAVVISTPNRLHGDQVLKSIAAGCHVLCEKPLGLDLAQTRAIHQAARDAEVRHMTAFTYRFVPGMRYLTHLVHGGELGEIRHARFQRLQDWGEDGIGWRQYRDQAGSGELGDMGIHRIDYAESLLGTTRAVCALLKQVVTRTTRPDGEACPPQDVEDWVAWIAEFGSGATGVFEMGKLSKGRGPGGDHDVAEINGSLASAMYQLHTPQEILLAKRGEPYRSVRVPSRFMKLAGSPRDPAEGDPVVTFRYDQAWEFVSAIREGRECVPSFSDGVRAQTVADAIVDAARDRRWMDVPGRVGACPGGHLRRGMS